MDVSSFPGKVDELAGQIITELVFTYDRGYMHPRLLGGIRLFSLKTTEMPLSVHVYSREKLLAKYSFKPPHVSGYTWRIEISAHPEVSFTILKKALTPNGPKHYTFRDACILLPDKDIYLAHSLYRTIRIICSLDLRTPTELEHLKKPGKNGGYLLERASKPYSYVLCEGFYEGYWDKVRVRRKLKEIKLQGSR